MKLNDQLFEDVSRMASGAVNALSGLKDQFEARHSGKGNAAQAVTREEFEAVSVMTAKARAMQEDLMKRIVALEEKLGGEKTTGPAGEDI